jgi:lysophospholipase L1-like esterase
MTQHEQANQSQPNRRNILLASAGLSAAGLAALAGVQRLFGDEVPATGEVKRPLIERGDTILFQGDSITDAGRKRDKAGDANSFGAMGNGYAWLAATQLLVDSPGQQLKVFNRGISGDKVYQLADRWQADCLDIKPNVLSILVGVNDFAHVHKWKGEGSVEKYEADYHALIKRTKDALPEVKLIVCEPFILVVGLVDESWVPGFAKYREAAQRVADQAGAVFVPFQTMFDHAAKIAPPAHWAADGIHPTMHGAALMAHWWVSLSMVSAFDM